MINFRTKCPKANQQKANQHTNTSWWPTCPFDTPKSCWKPLQSRQTLSALNCTPRCQHPFQQSQHRRCKAMPLQPTAGRLEPTRFLAEVLSSLCSFLQCQQQVLLQLDAWWPGNRTVGWWCFGKIMWRLGSEGGVWELEDGSGCLRPCHVWKPNNYTTI